MAFSPIIWFSTGAKIIGDLFKVEGDSSDNHVVLDSNLTDGFTVNHIDKNTNRAASMYADGTTGVSLAHEDASNYSGIDVSTQYGWATLGLSGSLNLTQTAYSTNFDELAAGYANHYVSFEPTTDVEVDSTKVGNIFILENNCGAAFDLIPAAAETFNGAASFTVADGTTYLFIMSNAGKYKVL